MPALKEVWPTTARGRSLRITAFAILAIGNLVLILSLIHGVVLPILAKFLPKFESFFYDIAVFGVYRKAKYVTFNITVPHGNMVKWDHSCEGGLVLIAPFGPSVERPGPIILDSHGELVWAADSYKTVTNFNVHMYKGQPYLTFWAGDKHGGEGSGAAFMLDSSYSVWKRITAIGEGLRTDIHEFVISDDGHALISTINETTADMRQMGWFHTENGWIEDSVFQDIDIETGELVFQWRSQDHYRPEDSYFWNPIAGYVEGTPYDFFHLNSVQKDSKGNYLISSRHLHKLLYVDGKTGHVLWSLGGEKGVNSFADLSGGLATTFRWQHHARWQSEEEGSLTLMDNGVAGWFHRDAPYSKALMLNIDQDNRTVELSHSYTGIGNIRSPSQGSVQILPNGNILVGWGSSAAWSEHKLDGELLCEYHFSAGWLFWLRRVKNYRTFKVYNWKGEPDYPPTAKIKQGRVYVSWNGATEVKFWKLQGVTEDDDTREEAHDDIATIEKRGFESAFTLPDTPTYAFFRVVALDGEKKAIRASGMAEEADSDESREGLILGICLGCTSAISTYILLRLRSRHRRNEKDDQGSWEMDSWRQYEYSRL